MKTFAAASALALFCLSACSDDKTPAMTEPTPAAAPTATSGMTPAPAPAPIPAADAPEPPAADLPPVDPSAEPIDPDELMKLRPD